MISFALSKKVDSESGHETESGLFTNKKRLLMVGGGALAFVLIMILVLTMVFSGSGTVKDPIQHNGKPGTVLVSGSVLSKGQSIKPAPTLAYVSHLLQTRWPVFVAVGAILVVSLILVVLVPTLLHTSSDNVYVNGSNSDSLVHDQEETESVSLLTMIVGVCGGIVVLGLIIGAIYYKLKPTVKPAETPIVPTTTTTTTTATAATLSASTNPPSDYWLFDLATNQSTPLPQRLFALGVIGRVIYKWHMSDPTAGVLLAFPKLLGLNDLLFPVLDNNVLDPTLSSAKQGSISTMTADNSISGEQSKAINALAARFRDLVEKNPSWLPTFSKYNRLCAHYRIQDVQNMSTAQQVLRSVLENKDRIGKKKAQ